MDKKTHDRLYRMYSELPTKQLREEIRWRSERPWTSHMICGADAMVVPNIKAICREILMERGVEVDG